MRDRRGTVLALIAALAGAAAVLMGTAAPANAHASLLSTDPEEGSVVETAPERIVLTFNEPVRLPSDPSGAATAFKPDGTPWPLTVTVADNRFILTSEDAETSPGEGTVVIAWKVLSADGHTVEGALTFSIGSVTASAGAADSVSAPISVRVARWVLTGAAGIGLLVAIALGLGGGLRHRAGSRAPSRQAWQCGGASAVLLAPVHELVGSGLGWPELLDWLVWLEGAAHPSSLLLLSAYAIVAIAGSVPHRAATATLTVAALVPLGGAALTWPLHDDVPADPASSSSAANTTGEKTTGTSTGTSTVNAEQTVELGSAGTVRFVARSGVDRTVTIELHLRDRSDQPLEPFTPPKLTLGTEELSLGTVPLTAIGAGSYRAEVTIPTGGSWTAQVSVRVDEFTNPVAEVSFAV